jgi:hypothetical protein
MIEELRMDKECVRQMLNINLEKVCIKMVPKTEDLCLRWEEVHADLWYKIQTEPNFLDNIMGQNMDTLVWPWD